MDVTDTQLLELNHQGIIPGPTETEEAFSRRAEYCLQLRQRFAENHGLHPLSEKDLASEEYLKPALSMTGQLYDCAPAWIPLFFSNFRLAPWHGGCAWIFQQNEEMPTSAFLQLRRAFAQSETYLSLYSRQEIIAHECCHVGRMCFEEPCFEEILAYRTSPSRLRRWLGAIAQSPWETLLFVLLLCLVLAVDLFALSLPWVRILPPFLVLVALLRLTRRQNQFSSCLARLESLLQDPQKASALIFRLTDKEIIDFSKMSPETIRMVMEEKKDSSLRWRLINLAYTQTIGPLEAPKRHSQPTNHFI